MVEYTYKKISDYKISNKWQVNKFAEHVVLAQKQINGLSKEIMKS